MVHTAPLLECRAVSARYGGITVCRDVSLSVARGEIVALLGPNGAGKTSLLGAVSGIVRGGGDMVLDGTEMGRLPADRRAHLGLRLVPEGRGLFPELSVRENLRLGSRLAPAARRQELIDRAIELFPILGDRLEQQAGNMSGGEQQMLAVGKAIAGAPSLLMLDEPTQGLAPSVFDVLRQALLALRDDGLGIVLVEQRHAFAQSVADRTAVLVSGTLVHQGEPGETIARDELMRIYTGAGVAA
ncbi:ABC transporter ATP-binding protein [Georgenia yuyongxinii]|uniref:ABC transporter ATP-binding protein n=1 Tax=Georgenia yuyongxinii TaxID=2589797 RepID=A0A552WU78_9MICO|nr:ABC transporter ATP-binding protein [Georgenia yuyongxinii]TRW45883.1 ABC transporter ATP-binding protein [Georgenia yuyongxinii]